MKNSDLQSTFIFPSWPEPANVKALQTTRNGGISTAPYNSLNLGEHVKDNPLHVAQNRQLLSQFVPSEPVWLNQVHGIDVIDAADTSCAPSADASYATRKNVICVTMTADCLPILLCDQAGTVVASIHAGWRSLCYGVIEATVKKMPVNPSQLMAWLGPAIGPNAFEVGGEVREQFIQKGLDLGISPMEVAFKTSNENQEQQKWLADIYKIATQRLNNLGVTQVYGGGQNECQDEHQNENWCTHTDENRFFSFRRDGLTGRMATLIWLA